MYPLRSVAWLPVSERIPTKLEFRVSTFSFSAGASKTRETYNTLKKICEAACRHTDVLVTFAPGALTDCAPLLILKALNEVEPVISVHSDDPGGRRLLRELRLGMIPGAASANENLGKLFPIKYLNSREEMAVREIAPNQSLNALVAAEIQATMEAWIDEAGQEIPVQMTQQFGVAISELLDNALLHSRPKPDMSRAGNWSIMGYMERREGEADPTPHYFCNVAIMSEGASFHKSMTFARESILSAMEQYFVDCERCGSNIHPDGLATVFALQIGNSRGSAEEYSAAAGLMTAMKLINEIGDYDTVNNMQSAVSILSGRNCVEFSSSDISCAEVSEITRGKSEMWLNKKNVSSLPPNEQNFASVEPSFRGAVISASFYLDRF